MRRRPAGGGRRRPAILGDIDPWPSATTAWIDIADRLWSAYDD
jgi:hypothetical protein